MGELIHVTPTQVLLWRITRYKAAVAERDALVLSMLAAGWNKRDIARELGISRTTVYRILGARYKQDHGRHRFTEPKVSHKTSEPDHG